MTSTSTALDRSSADLHRSEKDHSPIDDESPTLRSGLYAMLVAWAICTPILAIGGWSANSIYRQQTEARLAAAKFNRAHQSVLDAPALPLVSIDAAIKGREVFATTCAACHGQDAKGMVGLGRDLTISNFVATQDDEQLRQFIVEGRPTAVPVAMPPKGGKPELTDDDLRGVVQYVRGLQDARRMPALPALVLDTKPSDAQKAAALEAAGGDAELAKYIASGNKIFHSLCVACHGQNGVGIAGNGKALAKNTFVQSLNDDQLLAFVKQGRAPSDPKNTTGIQMPPKGGNPAMSDDDILDVISYLRTLQGKPAPKSP
ncbi:MAG: c-type cytochrome [Planctomycetes bacterium]|nr:c-type cytochrome [Planctomycetota bacterium]